MTEQVRVQVTVQVEQLMTPLALGWIERTIPDKPNSSKQSYRLTAQGKALRDEVGR